jgi:RHS repeat-associated protein
MKYCWQVSRQLRTSTGQDLLYVYDNIGSPVALITNFNTTAFQYSFDPYGVAEVDQTSGGNAIHQTPFLHTGGLHDRTTGWIKQGARYYNPTEGRWTQHDTLDTPLDPLNANRYAYAANNPVNYIDPEGRNAIAIASALQSLGFAVSAGTLAYGIATGDPMRALMGALSGAITTYGCYVVAVALGVKTGGALVGSVVFCEAIGALVSASVS